MHSAERDAWNGHALIESKGPRLALSYAGGSLAVIGDVWPQGARLRVTVGRPRPRGRCSLVAGPAPMEGVAIDDRR